MDDGCRSKLTRSNSNSSDITVESSYRYHALPQNQSAEWTNEKHNAYLGSLEASFVQQLHELHCSSGLRALHSQEETWRPYSYQQLSGNARNSSHQLMILQDDRWQKIKLAEKETVFDSSAGSHYILENPWIRRFTSVGERQAATSFDPQEQSELCDEGFSLREDMTISAEPAGRSEQHHNCHLWRQNSVESTTEVSDQNFVDEEQGHESGHGTIAKRLKTAAVNYPKDDQVVPSKKLYTHHVSAVCHASSEREELQEHHELMSEDPESFACTRSDVHYFLRGS